MNRNQIIGTFLGILIGYASQGFVYSKSIEYLGPKGVIAVKYTIKYTAKVIKYTTANYMRSDFDSDVIFSDAIDGSFFAD